VSAPISSKNRDDAKERSVKGDTATLRILATTDIHMQLFGYDYVSDQPTGNNGLAGIATLIAKARAEALKNHAGCILLDNGDIVQGTIIGDILATQPVTHAHPLVSCMNTLKYDAIGLGNHDLDFGLPYLRAISSHLAMPLVSTNLKLHTQNFVQGSVLIKCKLPERSGKNAHLKVGVLSILPAKTAIWNHHVLDGEAEIAPPMNSLRVAIKSLRARGAQVVVLLAHMGIRDVQTGQDENARSFAQLPGIDAIIAGHTHRRFPGRDHVGLSGVDATNGTIAQRPTIMPGNAGSDLAVLDLTLTKAPSGDWKVTDHASKLRANTPQTKPDPKITALCMPAHHAAQTHLSQSIGQTDDPLHTYFSLAMPTRVAALTARAKARIVRSALAGTTDAGTPLLASVAAHTAGGRGGPDHYLCIPKGPVLRRHIAGLSPHANQIWAVRITGADLLARLENTASVFHTLKRNNPSQPLIDHLIPAFNFDTVFGVSYVIDPTQPPGNRIALLQYQGHAVSPKDQFIMAMNQFRAAGGGGVIATAPSNIVLRSKINIADALIDALAHPKDAVWPPHLPWSFDCGGQVQAMLQTSPSALGYLADAAHLKPQHTGTTDTGFAELRLTL
jgi:2',3'-cyclic-nucleotide 2'-phosphodiesterase/3'-nucleotidase